MCPWVLKLSSILGHWEAHVSQPIPSPPIPHSLTVLYWGHTWHRKAVFFTGEPGYQFIPPLLRPHPGTSPNAISPLKRRNLAGSIYHSVPLSRSVPFTSAWTVGRKPPVHGSPRDFLNSICMQIVSLSSTRPHLALHNKMATAPWHQVLKLCRLPKQGKWRRWSLFGFFLKRSLLSRIPSDRERCRLPSSWWLPHIILSLMS